MPVALKEETKSREMQRRRKGNPNLGMIPDKNIRKEAIFFNLWTLLLTYRILSIKFEPRSRNLFLVMEENMCQDLD